MERPEITADDINYTIHQLQREIAKALNEKGNGAFVSRHEILGAMTEERKEVEDALHSGDLDEITEELLHLAVVGVIGAASMTFGRME